MLLASKFAPPGKRMRRKHAVGLHCDENARTKIAFKGDSFPMMKSLDEVRLLQIVELFWSGTIPKAEILNANTEPQRLSGCQSKNQRCSCTGRIRRANGRNSSRLRVLYSCIGVAQ